MSVQQDAFALLEAMESWRSRSPEGARFPPDVERARDKLRNSLGHGALLGEKVKRTRDEHGEVSRHLDDATRAAVRAAKSSERGAQVRCARKHGLSTKTVRAIWRDG